MGETLFETPIPYFAFASLIAGLVAAALAARRLSLTLLLVAPLLSGALMIGLVDAAVAAPLTTLNRLALMVVALAGTAFGALVVLASIWYARWVRNVYSRAEARLVAPDA
jgi:hypothetical protein